MSDFPTATAAADCVTKGECGNSLVYFAGRTAMMYGGLRVVGAKQPLKKAVAGSLAVQAFVVGWLATHGNAQLPSGLAVKDGHPASIAYTYAGRSAIAALGMYLAGARKGVVKESLAAIAPVEVAVLVWGSR